MKIEKAHIVALLSNPLTRPAMLEQLDRGTLSLDIDDLSSTSFDALHDAALDVLGNWEAPPVKTYSALGGYGDYSIEIIGVEGAYVVRASEFDDQGVYRTLEEAKSYISQNWWGEARET